MSYATIEDLEKRLDEMTLLDLADDADIGIIDIGIISTALESADVEIDAYLGERYSLPLSPVPAIIKKLAADIAVINLYARREGPPDHWQTSYNNAIKMLTKIQEKTLGLGASDPQAGNNDSAEVISSDRVFSRDTLKNF